MTSRSARPKIDQLHNYIGFCRFDHVRVPRFNLFAKNQQATSISVSLCVFPSFFPSFFLSLSLKFWGVDSMAHKL